MLASMGTFYYWNREFDLQTVGWVFESKPRQTYVFKTGRDSSIAKRSEIVVSVTDPPRWPYKSPVSQYMWHTNEPLIGQNFAVLHGDVFIWEKHFQMGRKYPKQTNKKKTLEYQCISSKIANFETLLKRGKGKRNYLRELKRNLVEIFILVFWLFD